MIESRYADWDRHGRRWTNAGIRHAQRDLCCGNVCHESKDASDNAGSESAELRDSQDGTWVLSDDWLRDGCSHLAFLHGIVKLLSAFFSLSSRRNSYKEKKCIQTSSLCQQFVSTSRRKKKTQCQSIRNHKSDVGNQRQFCGHYWDPRPTADLALPRAGGEPVTSRV